MTDSLQKIAHRFRCNRPTIDLQSLSDYPLNRPTIATESLSDYNEEDVGTGGCIGNASGENAPSQGASVSSPS
ncbi:MAG: hypothetical protein J1E07_11075, partial [Treponema sp.]|nr:hypothetical protein [Treponema sp.]